MKLALCDRSHHFTILPGTDGLRRGNFFLLRNKHSNYGHDAMRNYSTFLVVPGDVTISLGLLYPCSFVTNGRCKAGLAS
jgi:hypothetical protein